MKKALFLDRDGVVNIDHGYLYKPEQFEFIDGVFEGCRLFQNAGFDIVIITNQSGIGRGYYSEDDFHKLTTWMIKAFKDQGINILDVKFCPHHPKKAIGQYLQDCQCRKPAPGMLLEAMAEHQLDPKMSIMVGDKPSDMEAAINAGVPKKYLVTTGKTLSEQSASLADGVFDSLDALAKSVIVKQG